MTPTVLENKRLAAIVVAGGAALLALSLLANPLGIGSEGFGWKQIAGTIVGAIGIALGLLALARARGTG